MNNFLRAIHKQRCICQLISVMGMLGYLSRLQSLEMFQNNYGLLITIPRFFYFLIDTFIYSNIFQAIIVLVVSNGLEVMIEHNIRVFMGIQKHARFYIHFKRRALIIKPKSNAEKYQE